MPVAPIDIALLLVALASCGYCFLLNLRLKALHDTRDGMGATIQALSEAIARMNAFTATSGQQAKAAAEALNFQMIQSKAICDQLQKLVEEGRETSEVLSQRSRLMQREMSASGILFDDHVTAYPGNRDGAENDVNRRYKYED